MNLLLSLLGCTLLYSNAKTDLASLEVGALREWLFSQCSTQFFIRPISNHSEPVDVVVSLHAHNFRGIDDLLQSYSMICQVQVEWYHPCLRWGAGVNLTQKWAEILRLDLKASEIWVPGLFHLNSVEDGMFLERQRLTSRVHITQSGMVVWKILAKLTSSCNLKWKKFPFDTQTCGVSLQSIDPIENIRLNNKNTSTGKVAPGFLRSQDVWKLTNGSRQLKVELSEIRENGELIFHSLTFTIALSRKPHTYVVGMILPTLAMLLIAMSTGLMAPQSNRPVVCLTFLLVFTLMQASFSSSIPETSDVSYMLIFETSHVIIAMVLTIYAIISDNLSRKAFFRKKLTNRLMSPLPVIRLLDLLVYGAISIFAFVMTLVLIVYMAM